MPKPAFSSSLCSDGCSSHSVKPERWSAGQKRLPGRAKWCPVAAEYRPGLMPTKGSCSPGATTSRMPLPAAAASSALVGRAKYVSARLLVRLELDERLFLGFLEEVGKGAEAIIGFVEAKDRKSTRLNSSHV